MLVLTRVVLLAVAAVFLAGPALRPPAQTERLVIGDATFFAKGAYSAYASPWSTHFDQGLRHGRDYRDTISIDPARFPSDSRISWRWPLRRPTKSGVWGYMALSYGNYDGGEPETHVVPRRVDDIRTLRQRIALTHSGISSFNILNEFYLTNAPGRPADKAIEIGYFLRPSSGAMNFAAGGRRIGAYIDPAGRRWTVAMRDRFCMVMPDGGAEVTRGIVDVKHLLEWLKRHGVITGREWFNGIALGVEPLWGGGSLEIAEWRVRYD